MSGIIWTSFDFVAVSFFINVFFYLNRKYLFRLETDAIWLGSSLLSLVHD